MIASCGGEEFCQEGGDACLKDVAHPDEIPCDGGVLIEDTILWVGVVGVLVAMGIGYAVPTTRPYVKKYWWLGVIVAGTLLGIVLFRRRPGSQITTDIEDGRVIANENITALDSVIDGAKEQMARADADLTRARLREESARQEFDSKLEAVDLIDDSLERRKALIKLVEGAKS